MSAKVAAVHFNNKVIPHLQHNDRTNCKSPNIFGELTHLNECDVSASQAMKTIDRLYKESMSILEKAKKKGKRTPKERSYHEAIFEIDENTTMAQCQELADKICELTGFRKLQVSVHRDEGHFEEGKFKTHYHAHAVFFTLDKHTGKQLARLEASLHKGNMSKMQTLASEVFGMQRGKEYYKNNQPSPKSINDYRDYKPIAEAQRKLREEQVRIDIQQENLRQREQILKQNEASQRNRLKMIKEKERELIEREKRIQEEKARLEFEYQKSYESLKKFYESKLSFWKNALTFGKHNKGVKEEFNLAKDALNSSFKESEEVVNKELERLNKELEAERKERKSYQNLASKLSNELQNSNQTIDRLNTENNRLISKYEPKPLYKSQNATLNRLNQKIRTR